MDAIAEEADVAVGSIYHHFRSKDNLYLALVERALEINEQVMAEAYSGGRTPMEELIAASDAYCRFNLENIYQRPVDRKNTTIRAQTTGEIGLLTA